MNTKNNKRSQNTDEAIIRAAFEAMLLGGKQISKITVREICEKAGINRSTFYAHYTDVYDLFERVELKMAEMCGERMMGNGYDSFHGMLERVFEFILEYKEFYQIYFSEVNKATHLIQVMTSPFKNRVADISSQDMGFGIDGEATYHFNFFTAGLSSMIAYWLERNCKDTPAEVVDMVVRQYNGSSLVCRWMGLE